MAGNQLGPGPSGLVARPCGAFIEDPGRPSSGISCRGAGGGGRCTLGGAVLGLCRKGPFLFVASSHPALELSSHCWASMVPATLGSSLWIREGLSPRAPNLP